MKILIIRHADPDYEHDTLTEKGWREAELLSEKLVKYDVKNWYVSSLGRAQDTLAPTLKKNGQTAEVCDWLREFDKPRIWRPDHTDHQTIAWDWMPKDWTACPEFFDKEKWSDNAIQQAGNTRAYYDEVVNNLDRVIAEHGYVREGDIYRTEQGHGDTIAFVCHFGSGSILLARLLNISPMVVWQNFCCLPSSVTTLVTEEREKGYAAFRMLSYGSTEHLYVANEEPSFAARFREIYENYWERID